MNNYSISEYVQRMKDENLLITFEIKGKKNQKITNLTYNSKEVSEGTLFVCKGAAFKKEYLDEAIKHGAIGYVSETAYDTEIEIPYILVSDIRKAMPGLASLFFHHPAKKLKITGIGGTKGKSTTAYYVKAIVDDFLLANQQKESAVISSIDVYDGVIREESHITTPENIELQRHFRNALNSGISYVEMEVSSQALKYHRVDQIPFEVGIFLNISEDHISPIEHPNFEDYFSSKLKMFSQTRHALICTNSDYFERVQEAAKNAQSVLTFGTKAGSDIYGYDIHKVGHETHFKVKCDRFDKEFVLTMPGLFNVENALAAIAAAYVYEIPYEYMYSGLKRARSSGRMECYASTDNQVVAIVDYAHNKLSFEKLFESTKQEYPDSDIISIFGCPGKKALIRRHDLGTIAGMYAQKVYLVAEDPGEEPVEEISKDIAQYVKAQNCPYEMIEDRGIAIHKAINECIDKTKQTVLLITGKGNETRQKYGRQYLDCTSDVEYVKQYLKEYNEAGRNKEN